MWPPLVQSEIIRVQSTKQKCLWRVLAEQGEFSKLGCLHSAPSKERFIFVASPLLAPGGWPWNIFLLDKSVFKCLKPWAMQHQFDQIIYAGKVISGEQLVFTQVAQCLSSWNWETRVLLNAYATHPQPKCHTSHFSSWQHLACVITHYHQENEASPMKLH